MTLRFLPLVALAAAVAVAAPQSKRANDPDMKELHDYRLSMEKIQKYLDAYKVISKDAAAAACFKDKAPGNQPTLDLGVKQIEACGPAVADLKAAGLAPREFLLLTASLLGNIFAMEMKHAGQIKEYPASTVSPENAAFLDQNYDKIKALTAPLMNQSDKDDKDQ